MAYRIMTSGHHDKGRNGKGHPAHRGSDKPDWADGLRQLYDSVVDEPIPDSFMDLLAQLDDESGDAALSDGLAGGKAGGA